MLDVTPEAATLTVCKPDGSIDRIMPITAFDMGPFDADGGMVQLVAMIAFSAVAFLLILSGRDRAAPQQVVFPRQFMIAPLGSRILATMIDILPFMLLIGGATAYWAIELADIIKLKDLGTDDLQRMQELGYRLAMTQTAMFIRIGGAIVCLAYCVFCERRFGTTLGKMAMGIRVVSLDGDRPGVRQLFIRNLLKMLMVFFGLWFLMILPLLNPGRQRLGDLFGRTVVVRPTTTVDLSGLASRTDNDRQPDEPDTKA